MPSAKVIVIADIYDSFPNLESKYKQEWESKKSIDFLLETIDSIGYEPILVEPKKGKIQVLEILKDILAKPNVSKPILFNLVEGYTSRNREAYIPALGEFFGIAYTGSDAYAQSLTLDKSMTKLVVNKLGIPTKNFHLIRDKLKIPNSMKFPLFLKPNAEGSSLGISQENIINDRKDLESRLKDLLGDFKSILLEEYLEGDDLTLGVIGNYPDYLPTSVAKVEFPSSVYSQDIKSKESMPETLHFTLEKSLERKIQKDSVEICKWLQVSGYARLDWKCDAKGNPFFLEINLTPGLSRFYSSLPICFEASYGNYSDLIKKILHFGYDNYNTSKFFDYGKLEKI